MIANAPFHTPELFTKELAVQTFGEGQRRVRLSSNLIRGLGFEPHSRIAVQPGCGGLVVRPDVNGSMQVYERNYPQRPRGGREAVVEFATPSLMRHIPNHCDRVHFEVRAGEIRIRPVGPKLFHIRQSFRKARELSAFMAMSSGLDAWVFSQAGMRVRAALEYRPQEARDVTDKTETGMRTFLANNRDVVLAYNEDVSTADFNRIARDVRSRVGPVAVVSIGLQCDDHSNAKSASKKREEIATFEPSARELVHYALNLVEALTPAAIMVEQVPGWHGSESQAVFGAVLRRMGYFVQAQVLNGAEYGALTSRKRCYLVGSIFPGFTFPAPTGANTVSIRTHLAEFLPQFRDISGNKAMKDAPASGYARFASLDATTCPTVMKSQSRLAKDTCVFAEGDKLLLPTIDALKKLHGLPADFALDAVSDEIATEQIGQGIEVPLHLSVAKQLAAHLAANNVTNIGGVTATVSNAQMDSDLILNSVLPACTEEAAVELPLSWA